MSWPIKGLGEEPPSLDYEPVKYTPPIKKGLNRAHRRKLEQENERYLRRLRKRLKERKG